MNLVLFEAEEADRPLPRTDVRARHVLEVLRRGVGDTFDAGVVDGPFGKATITAIDASHLSVHFVATRSPPPLPDITLIVGLPRPATARDVLRDATTMGVRAMHFVTTERTTPSYATSRLWTHDEARAQLLLGAAQAFDTRIPSVTAGLSLGQALDRSGAARRLALDNYEAPTHLASHPTTGAVTLLFGPERGWGPRDRAELRAAGATLHHLGARVLRLEMAVVAALTLVRCADERPTCFP